MSKSDKTSELFVLGLTGGSYYNNFTIKFIEKSYQEVTDLEPFNAIETIKKKIC